jgi:nitrate/nitrite transporter NarK
MYQCHTQFHVLLEGMTGHEGAAGAAAGWTGAAGAAGGEGAPQQLAKSGE